MVRAMADVRSVLLSQDRPLVGFDVAGRAHPAPDAIAPYDDEMQSHLARLGRPLRWAWGRDAAALDTLRRLVAAQLTFDGRHPLAVLPEGAWAASDIVAETGARRVLVVGRLELVGAALAARDLDVTVCAADPRHVVGLEPLLTIHPGAASAALPADWIGRFDAVLVDSVALAAAHTAPLQRLAQLCTPEYGRLFVLAHRQEGFALRFDLDAWGLEPKGLHNDVVPRLTPSLEVPDVFWDLWEMAPQAAAFAPRTDRALDDAEARKEEPSALRIAWGEQIRGFDGDVTAAALDAALAAWCADLDPGATPAAFTDDHLLRRHLASPHFGDALLAADNQHRVVTLAFTHWSPGPAQALANLVRAHGPTRHRFVDPTKPPEQGLVP